MSSPQTSTGTPPPIQPRGIRLGLVLLPLLLFAALAVVFVVALQTGDPSRLPSVLIGKPVPAFELPPIEEMTGPKGPTPGLSSADLARGQVSIVNVWASWCGPCQKEHPHLTALAKASGAPLMGINYKDKPEEARRFLGRYGNPFTAIGADKTGRVALDWGVYGVPETFIVDGRGEIVFKHVGEVTPELIERKLLPIIAKARANAAR